jgi:hypothetical protein
MATSLTSDQIKERIKLRVTKNAAAATATDPTEKGKASIPVDPNATKDAQNMPPTESNKSREGVQLEDKDTKPSSTGKNVPTAADGDAKDKAGIKKANITDIKNRVKALTKSATPAATEPEVAPAVANTPEPVKSAANAPILDLDREALLKLAHAIVSTDEGIDLVMPLLRKQVGRETAALLVKEASAEFEKALTAEAEVFEMQKQAAAQEAAEYEYLDGLVKSASSDAEAKQLVGAYFAHKENRNALATEWEKSAYDQSVDDAATMMEADEAGAEPSLEGAEAPSLEQILMLLEAAVQSGEIDEETAAQIAEELLGDPEMAGAEGGAPPADPAAEGGMPPEDPAMAKMASANPALKAKLLFKKLAAVNK